ncbi:ion transporter [Ignavibacterium sp.]|jgi:voltage-gated potassium channel|uniref:ion transporter n=1 Tax=Ignavibacterium sp. TaxID=2651167 RepID=UPI0025BC6C7C|nr:ion transporter [Ignavibacterium sp.]
MDIKSIIQGSTRKYSINFELFIQSLIVLSLVEFTIETIPNLSPSLLYWLDIFELTTVIIFSIEYLLRILSSENKIRYIFSFYGIIDLIAILPFYLSQTIDLRSIRIFRLLRIFRAFKLVRYSQAIKRFKVAFLMIKEELIIFLIVTIFVIFFSSVAIYYFESEAQPDKFSSVLDCMWWSIVTLTTVGYGDVYPITVGGKIFTFLILIVGLGVIAVPTGLISSALTKCIADENQESSSNEK